MPFTLPKGKIQLRLILKREKFTILPGTMKNLGPYKKYIVAAAVIQSIIVVVAGYLLFRAMADKASLEHQVQEKPGVEEPLKNSN